jgi:CheY-like chemotaxis protein
MVVLLVNKMPKVTGLEVLKIMKDDDHLKLIPVVALASSRETPDLPEFSFGPTDKNAKEVVREKASEP